MINLLFKFIILNVKVIKGLFNRSELLGIFGNDGCFVVDLLFVLWELLVDLGKVLFQVV